LRKGGGTKQRRYGSDIESEKLKSKRLESEWNEVVGRSARESEPLYEAGGAC
jgi:hypothetical protein